MTISAKKMLDCYLKQTGRMDSGAEVSTPSALEVEASRLAAAIPEHVLRTAVVISATYNRNHGNENSGKGDKACNKTVS